MTATPITVEKNETMARALKLMDEHGIRHLPVMDAGRLVGLVSERELKIVENMESVDSAYCLVGDAIVRAPFEVSPDEPVSKVARTMADERVGSAVVVDGTQVIGLFTSVDALRTLADVLEGKA